MLSIKKVRIGGDGIEYFGTILATWHLPEMPDAAMRDCLEQLLLAGQLPTEGHDPMLDRVRRNGSDIFIHYRSLRLQEPEVESLWVLYTSEVY